MFDSVFSSGITVGFVFLTLAVALVSGIIIAFIFSFKLRSSKGFFITISLLPSIVSLVFAFLNIMVKQDTSLALVTIGAVMVGLGLIRFRSAPGKAEEMIALFGAVAIGTVYGMGYLLYGAIFTIVLPLIYLVLASFNFLKAKKSTEEKLLKITIPESLEYSDAFDETFKHYLKEYELVGVKTTGMGSMYKLSYRIVMKDIKEEKEMIDELRIKNGNLEISVLPYVEDVKGL